MPIKKIAAFFLLMIALVSCAQAAGDSAKTFVGSAADSEASIALVTDGSKVSAYICDGETISTWFSGDVTNNAIDLTSGDGTQLQAALTDTSASGTITLADGQVLSFSASPAESPAGLYRAEQTVDGESVVAGWIVAPDGTQVGGFGLSGIVVRDVPQISPDKLVSVHVPGVGDFLPQPINKP